MTLIERLFGNRNSEQGSESLVANPKLSDPLSFEVLFERPPSLDSSRLMHELRILNPTCPNPRCEIDNELGKEGHVVGLVGWDKHVVRLIGFDAPMPSNALEVCIEPSHYNQDLKAKARAHSSHVILNYVGYEFDPLEQYVALALTAAALLPFGALLVVNEVARTSFPASSLPSRDPGEDLIEKLRSWPFLLLYCGLVKYVVEETSGVWIRTHGAHVFGLPDLAVLAGGHDETSAWFDRFLAVFGYLQESRAKLAAGHTMQIGEEVYLRFREPALSEYFLETEGRLLVAEEIQPDDINKGA